MRPAYGYIRVSSDEQADSGLGLEAHEDPSLDPGSATVLESGMVVTVEPGVYVPGWGGVRIEDDVVVEEGGCRLLTGAGRGLEHA